MSDSCNGRNVFAGTANMYSNPSDFSTSTMKSEPGREMTGASASDGLSTVGPGREPTDAGLLLVSCAAATAVVDAATVAAALAVATFRKPRRLTFSHVPLDLFAISPSSTVAMTVWLAKVTPRRRGSFICWRPHFGRFAP